MKIAKVASEMRPIVKALKKDMSDRSRYENDNLVDYFQHVSCFKSLNFSNSDLLRCVSCMDVVWVPKHEVLIRCGDQGDNFYICLSGRCQLFIENPERKAYKNQIKELDQ